MSPSSIFAARLCARVGEQRQRVPTCFVNCDFLFCNSTIKTAMVQQMLSQIGSHGSVVKALRFISERLPVLTQAACFCPSGVSAPTLFKSSETKPALTSRRGGCLREDNSYFCWDQFWGKDLTGILSTRCPLIFQSPSLQSGHRLGSHVIILYRAS